jgi:antitoxin MazE
MDVTLEEGRIVLAPVRRRARAGWAESAKKLAAEGDGAPVWPEFGNAEDETIEW